MKWEYIVEKCSPGNTQMEMHILNEMGSKGWELICIRSHSVYPGAGEVARYYYKRLIQVEQ